MTSGDVGSGIVDCDPQNIWNPRKNCGSFHVDATSSESKIQQESRVVARKPRDAAAVLFSLKFADDSHYKFKSSHASLEARLQSSKDTGTEQNLTQNGDSRSFKVTCFGVSASGTAIRH